jgi:hypothetical protein
MSNQSNIVINTLERAVSTDFNNAETLMNRLSAEIGRALAFQKTMSATRMPEGDLREHVASGLLGYLSGGTVYVSAGMLMQQIAASPPQVPTPGTYDSLFRVGLLMADEALSDPVDGTNAFWLLEGRVERSVTLTETRDIYNPGTATFAPSGAPIDKVQESLVEFTWKKGTATTLPASTAGYAPILGLYRPAGGGAITEVDIIQLAVQLDDLDPSTDSSAIRTSARLYSDPGIPGGIGTNTDDVYFDFSGSINGKRVFARAPGGVSLRTSTYVDPTDAGVLATSGLWWYIYLVPLTDRMPAHMYGNTDVDHRGVLVISRTAPNAEGTNGAAVNLPNPVGGSVTTGNALFVGTFRTTGAAARILYVDIARNGEGRVAHVVMVDDQKVANGFLGTGGSPLNLATAGAGGTELVPYGCHLKCSLQNEVLDVAGLLNSAVALEMKYEFAGDNWNQQDAAMCFASALNLMNRIFELYHIPGLDSLTLTARSITATLAASAGGTADLAGNEYETIMWGIRLT